MSSVMQSDTTRIALSVLGMTLVSLVAAFHWVHSSFWLVMLTTFTMTGSGFFWILRQQVCLSDRKF